MWSVLQVDRSGLPIDWLHPHDAAGLMCNNRVSWTSGPVLLTLHGGWNRHAVQSTLDIPAIIGMHEMAPAHLANSVPSLGSANLKLFERDRHLCAYCGNQFSHKHLTREHIKPTSRGGKDVWTNVVTACVQCNSVKGNRTPEEANMPLLYLPYAPNWFEHFLLLRGGKRILADQMEFLADRLPRHSRLRQ